MASARVNAGALGTVTLLLREGQMIVAHAHQQYVLDVAVLQYIADFAAVIAHEVQLFVDRQR